MTRCYHLSLCWGFLLVFVGTVATCSAQVRRYQPRKPTISPYTDLFRFNNGALPNYYALVRPQLNQRAFNLQEQALRQQQAGALQRLQNDVQLGLLPAAQTGTGSWFMIQGTRSTYLDTSPYYHRSSALGNRGTAFGSRGTSLGNRGTTLGYRGTTLGVSR